MTGSGDTIVVADVGNTRIKLAVVAEAGNGAGRALPTVTSRQDLLSREFRAANLEAWLGRVAPGATVILVASVHDAAAARLEAAVAEVAVTRHRSIRQRRVTREHLPLEVDVDEPSRVGIDRLAAAAAAVLDDADLFLAFRHFQFGNAGFLNEVDELLEFSEIHIFSSRK